MPDYTQLRLRRDIQAPTEAQRDPFEPLEAVEGEIYYTYPEGLEGPVYEYWPTETAGMPDLRSITVSREEATQRYLMRPEVEIEYLPQQDYELGRLTIKRQFTDDMKIANGFKDIDPQTYEGLTSEARMTMQSRLAKLQMNLDRAEMAFKQIRQNPNFSPDEQFIGKTNFYDANPVWQEPGRKAVKAEKPVYTQAHVQNTLGALATNTDIIDRESALAFAAKNLGQNFAQEYPEALDIIINREKTGFAPLTPAGVPEEPTIPEEPSFWQKLKNLWPDEEVPTEPEEIIAEQKPAIAIPGILPPKPLGFPDAVWNEKMKSWTIIRNGRLQVWRP